MSKKVNIKDLESCKVLRTANDLQFWKKSTIYHISELLDRRTKLQTTINKLTNANLPNEMFKVIVETAQEVITNIDVDKKLSYKDNIIAKLQKEYDNIEWLLTFGSDSSSSSSSSSSRSYSSSSSSKSSSSRSSSSSSNDKNPKVLKAPK